MIVLSCPEPQITILEEKIISELQSYKGMVVFIKGMIEKKQTQHQSGNITFYKFMQSEQL